MMFGLIGRMAQVQKAKVVRYLLWSLALALTGWTLSQLPLGSIVESISALSAFQWLVWFAVNTLLLGLGTQRWYGLIRMLNAKLNFANLFCIRQAGQAVSFITPGPQFGGEPLQILWLCRAGVPLEKALLSLGLDRFYELAINFSVLIIGLLLLVILPNTPLSGAYHLSNISSFGIGVFILVVVCVLVVGALRWSTAKWGNHARVFKFKKAWQSLNGDLRLAWQTQKLALINALLLSLISWVILIAELALVLDFVGVSFDPIGLMLILVAMRLALLLPIPGGVGTLEAAIFWSFQSLGLPASAALGAIALMRLRDAFVLLFGLGCLRWVGRKSTASEIESANIVEKPTSLDAS
jgi:uncharacterized protein (TIRG00374 family)